MSARIDAAADVFFRNSGLGDSIPQANALTVAFWYYLVSDTNAAGLVFRRVADGAGTVFQGLSIDSTGTGLTVDTNAGASAATTLSTGTWYWIAYRRNGSTHDLLIDGAVSQTVSASPAADTAPGIAFGSDNSAFTDARFSRVRIWEAALTDAEILAERYAQTPARLADLWARYDLLAGARTADSTQYGRTLREGGTITDEAEPPRLMTADGATWALSGGQAFGGMVETWAQPNAFQSNAFQIYGGTVSTAGSYTITADGGTYAYTGGDANLLYARRLVADGGTYALTGGDALLKRGWTITADGASYALSGGDATLLYARRLVADGATYALAGGDANLLYARRLVADGASYALTGGDATLTYTPASAFTLTADGASFAVTGGDASLLYARVMPADGGTYAYTGGDANLLFGRRLTADGATYALTGGDANLIAARVLTADGATYAFSGGDATLTYTPANTLVAEGASYAFTGGDANLIYSGAGTQATQGAAGGRRPRYVAWINGRRYIGSLEEIQALVQVLAEQDAEKAAKGEKPKRRRIVIEAGKPANKLTAQGQKQPEMPQEAVIAVQQDTRRLYELAYAKAMADIEFENDDEESILLLL